MSKYIAVVLALMLLLSVPAQAAEAQNTRASYYFTSSSVYLHMTSETTFEAWFDVTCTKIMEKVGAQEIRIQRSSDNENWNTIRTFTMEEYPELIYENDITHVGCVSHGCLRGYYYRAKIQLYAYDGVGTGVWTRYTDSVYIPFPY